MAKKKGIIEQISDKVGEVLHPIAEHHPVVDPSAQAEAAQDIQAEESSSEKNEYQEHPKFAKFNSKGEN